MKKAVSIMAVTALVFGIGITTSFAQGRQGGMRGGPGGGPGGMFGRQSAADTVCNLLVLNAERGEKVEKALSALQEKFAESMRESFESMRDMSREERREAMQKVREEQSEEQAKALKEILSEKELKAIKPFLSAFGIRSTAELRTLRLLDLKDEQRAKLQEIALAYGTGMQEIQPARGAGRGQGGPGGPPEGFEEMQKKMETLGAKFQEQSNEVLTSEQQEAWKAKAEEEQAKMDEEREQMRQRFQGGGGPGGQGQGGQGQGRRGQRQ